MVEPPLDEPLPLSGIRVAVPATRRAVEAEALIQRWGGTCLVGPLLEEVPVQDEGPLRAATEEILAAPATWSLHLTGVGTRRWFGGAADTVSIQIYGEPVPGLTGAIAATGARAVTVAPYRWALPVDPDRRTAAEDVVRAIAGAEVSRSGLEREGVPVDFVAHPSRLGALVRGMASSSERIRAKAGL